jgi:serine/threonine-protein kinase
VRLRSQALRGDLDNIVGTALRKEPERRYPSADALRDDVERFLDHRPVSAHADSLGYRARKFVRRHRVGVATSVAAALALASGVGVALWQAKEARLERDRAQSEKARAEEMNAFLRSVLTSADPVRGQGRQVTVAEVLDGASSRLGAALGGQPQTEAPLRETLGETYRNLGLPEPAEREARRALALRGCAGPARDLACEETSVSLARALSDQGRWPDAERELRGVLDRTNSVPKSADLRGRALDELCVSLQNLGKGEEAVAPGREAVALLRGRGVSPDISLASALNDLAIALGNTGHFAEAEGLHREAVAAARAAGGEDHPLYAQALANLAGVVEMRSPREAEPLYRDAVGVLKRQLGEGHPRYVRTLVSYASLFGLLGEPARGVPLGREALALAQKHLEAVDPTVAYAEATLASLLVAAGEGHEAETHARAALASRRRTLPAGHWLIANVRTLLGAALFLQGRDAAAETELLAAYDVLLADRGPAHEKTRVAASWLARLYQRRGDPTRAAAFARAAKVEAAS